MNVYIYLYILRAARPPELRTHAHSAPARPSRLPSPPLPPSPSSSLVQPRPRPWTLQGRTCSQTVCQNNMNILNFYYSITTTKYRVYSSKYTNTTTARPLCKPRRASRSRSSAALRRVGCTRSGVTGALRDVPDERDAVCATSSTRHAAQRTGGVQTSQAVSTIRILCVSTLYIQEPELASPSFGCGILYTHEALPPTSVGSRSCSVGSRSCGVHPAL